MAGPLASAEISSGAGAVGLTTPDGVMAAETAIVTTLNVRAREHDSAVRDAPDHGAPEPDYVCVGAAGAAAAPEAAHRLARRLGHRWPHAEIVVASDAATSHAGALAGHPGVVLAAGTGAVVLGVAPDGTVVQVDGCGPWLGDDGSGAWIGREALRLILRGLDGRGPASVLADAAAMIYKCEPSSLPLAIAASGNAPSALAAFAPEVARAAENGDATAMEIIDTAAKLLAESVCAAVRRVVDTDSANASNVDASNADANSAATTAVRTALTGGLLRLGPVLLDRLTARLESADIDLRPAHGTALDGACLLALHTDTVHEPALVRLAPAGVTP